MPTCPNTVVDTAGRVPIYKVYGGGNTYWGSGPQPSGVAWTQVLGTQLDRANQAWQHYFPQCPGPPSWPTQKHPHRQRNIQCSSSACPNDSPFGCKQSVTCLPMTQRRKLPPQTQQSRLGGIVQR